MSEEIITENANSDQKPVEQSNLTVDGLIARRLGTLSKPPEANPPQEEGATEDAPEQGNPEPSTKEKDVLSNIDLESMSESELRDLSDKLGSRAVARFGELTARRKQAEEQIAALQAELQKRNEVSPLDVSNKVENNPYAAIDSVEKLQAKAKEVEDVIEWAEDMLFKSDHLSYNDIATMVDGKEMTKADIRNALQNARKARNKYLPAQLQELQSVDQRKNLKSAFEESARKELTWLSGEDNDLRKQYEAMINDPRLSQLEKAAPELAPQLSYILAHAANSIYGRKVLLTESKPKMTPPSSPAGNSASSDKPEGRSSKAVLDTKKRFAESGRPNDFIALRALQLSKR